MPPKKIGIRCLGSVFHRGQNHRFPIDAHKIHELARGTYRLVITIDLLHSVREQLFGLTTGGQFGDRAQNFGTTNRNRSPFRVDDRFPPARHPYFVAPTAFKQ